MVRLSGLCIGYAPTDQAELILTTEGDGEYFIGDRIYPVRKGDLVIYVTAVVHDEYLESGRIKLALLLWD